MYNFGIKKGVFYMSENDPAVMSVETYEEKTNRFKLYDLIKEGLDDISHSNTRPFSEAMSSIKERRKK